MALRSCSCLTRQYNAPHIEVGPDEVVLQLFVGPRYSDCPRSPKPSVCAPILLRGYTVSSARYGYRSNPMPGHACTSQAAYNGSAFDEYIFRYIIEAALDGWTPEVHIRRNTRTSSLSSRDTHALRFLSRCCLVNRVWHSIARPLLYRSVSLDDKSKNLHRVLQNPRVSALVRYLSLKSDSQCGATSLSALGDLPSLRSLAVKDAITGDIIGSPLLTQSSCSLKHLLYEGGDTHQLGELLTMLPNLTSLHIGRFSYSPRRCIGPRNNPISCKLRHVTFQSVYHYDASLFGWLFKTSRDSIEHLAVVNYGSLLNDLTPHFKLANKLELTIKRNVFGVPEDPDQYQLSAIIPHFQQLEEVCLHVGQDWNYDWPDVKHALLREEFPRIHFKYVKGKVDFLDSLIPQDSALSI